MRPATELRRAARPPRPGIARYVYGLIRTDEDRNFGAIGLEHRGERARVYTLRVGSIGAVVSDHACLERLPPLRQNLEGHHRVIREVMAAVTILPMSFGHLASGEDQVRGLLLRHQGSIAAELERIDGRAEMGLRIRWDVDNVFEHLLAGDRDLASYRDRLFGGPRAPSMAEKMELGRRFERHLDGRREELRERVMAGLMGSTIEARLNPPKNERVAMDASFLVARDGTGVFEETLDQVAASLPACYLLDYSGPWAPFHFVALDLQWATG